MKIVTSLADLRLARHALGGSLGLVMTRPALHAGPLSLVGLARAECAQVAVGFFAKPGSSGTGGDEAGYAEDLARLEALGVDMVWAPALADASPPGFQTWVTVEQVTAPLEGKHRPGHFREAATRVARYLNAFEPQRAYFGQKDAQQVIVVRRLARDLNYPVEIVAGPIVREADGLAASRDNAHLSTAERAAAPVLQRALSAAQAAYAEGERDGDALRAILSSSLAGEPLAREEYVSVADPETLDELERLERGALLSLAARVGKTRLTDNIVLE